MNKPPEKLRVFIDKKGNPWIFAKDMILEQLNSEYSGNHFLMPWREFYYTLEKPMTQKTENLTEKEAWIAMANGECVKALRKDYRVYKGELLEWSITLGTWMGVTTMGVGPYSIVPDPSKPKEVEDDKYEKDRIEVINGYINSSSDGLKARLMIEFVERNYQRKP